MALEIDAFSVLRIISANPAVFINIRTDATKLAGGLAEKLRLLLVKQIKSNGTLVPIREIRDVLGAETFSHVVGTMKDTELKALVGKLDKHHPEQKAANSAWRRTHLLALVDGSAEPMAKPVKKKRAAVPGTTSRGKAKKSKQDQDDEFLHDESAGAVRNRR